MKRAVLAALLTALSAASLAHADAGPPAWVAAIADSADPGTLPGDAVVLLDSHELRVDDSGAFQTTRRSAILVRRARGSDWCRALAPYVEGQSRVRDFRAWIVPRGGAPVELSRKELLDAAIGMAELHGEGRVQIMDGSERIRPGESFVWEWTTEDRPPYLQVDLTLVHVLPTKRAEVSVQLPDGWRLESHLFGEDSLAVVADASATRWRCFDVPGHLAELSDRRARWSPTRVALRLVPPKRLSARDFSNWNDVGDWLHMLAEPSASVNGALRQRAQALRESGGGEYAKLASAAAIARDVRYVSIQLGIGRGGGYRPKPASRVLETGYGDCKDKANLLVTLVREMGGRAWLVPTYSGDPDAVHPEWATPQQFNHCIAAIAVSDTLRADGVLRHPTLGPLLFVDPTAEQVPFGQLPGIEQGGFALVVTDSGGDLVRLPSAPPEHIGSDCSMEVSLDPDGVVTTRWEVVAQGELASALREAHANGGDPAVHGLLERELRERAVSGTLSAFSWSDDGVRVTLRYTSATREELRDLGDGTFAWRAPVGPFAPRTPSLDAGRRSHFRAARDRRSERVTLHLPDGWSLAESSAPADIARAAGRYVAHTRPEERVVRIEREWSLRESDVAPVALGELRDLFGAADAEARALHVLRRAR